LKDAPPLDTIVIPGGSGLRVPVVCREVAAWLRERAPATRRVTSVCTGVYALAASGLIDGRRATTHWRFAADVARLHPQVSFDPDAIFVRDGPYATSAGTTAGIDLALALVEEDLGSTLALAVARELVVYMKRTGGQLQYSEPLQFQTLASNEFSDLGTWLLANLDGDLSTERLAEHVGLSERQFRRRFEATFGASPARYVERLRLDEGRRRLETCGTIESIAHAVGYDSGDAFRRSFERFFGIGPTSYRARVLAQETADGNVSDGALVRHGDVR
jgi:transcriptional regulator GlxA family with amidase domain